MGNLSKYARPYREHDSKQTSLRTPAAPQRRATMGGDRPRFANSGVISQALRGSRSFPEIERLIADALSMLGW